MAWLNGYNLRTAKGDMTAMKHFTGLAHLALYTTDLEGTIRFYELLGGQVTGRAEVEKPAGTNRLAMVALPGFSLEIIEPHDGSPVTAEGGLFPHVAIQVDDINAAVSDLRAAGISTFRAEAPMDMPIFGGIRNIFCPGPNGERRE